MLSVLEYPKINLFCLDKIQDKILSKRYVIKEAQNYQKKGF